MASDVDICSAALVSIGAGLISDLDEGNDRARAAKALWTSTMEATLRSHPWNCATKRVVLSPEVDAPAYDWAFQFNVPQDLLRIVSVGKEGIEPEYRVESGRILADENVLYLRYIWRNDQPATWDTMLVKAMELAMAAELAYPITKSTSLMQAKQAQLADFLRRARAVDGQEEPSQTVGDFPLLQARWK